MPYTEYKFTYQGNKEGLKVDLNKDDETSLHFCEVKRKDIDDNFDLIGRYSGSSDANENVHIALYYNKKGTSVYFVQTESSGLPKTEDGKVKAYDVFSDSVTLEKGQQYTLIFSYDSFKLKDVNGRDVSSDKSSYFSMKKLYMKDEYSEDDVLLNAFELDSEFKSGEIAETATDISEEETDETSDAETTKNEEDSNETSHHELQIDKVTEEIVSSLTETGIETQASENVELIETESQTDLDLNHTTGVGKGWVAVVIVLAILLAIAVGGCVMVVIQLMHTNRQLDEKERAHREDAKRTEKNSKKAFNKLEKESRERIQALSDENTKLKSQLIQVAKKLEAVKQENTERANDQNLSADLNAKIQKLEEEKKSLGQSLIIARDKKQADDATISVLRNQVKMLQEQLDAVKIENNAPKVDKSLLIATQEEALADYPDAVYLGISTNFSGEAVLREVNYMRAQLVMIGGKGYPNPAYLTGLKSGRESYSSLEPLQNVFRVNRLINDGSLYGIKRIVPAEISKQDDRFVVTNMGELELELH